MIEGDVKIENKIQVNFLEMNALFDQMRVTDLAWLTFPSLGSYAENIL